MRLGDTSLADLRSALTGVGCPIHFGPFVLRAKTNDASLSRTIRHLYANHTLASDEIADATISVDVGWDARRPWRRVARLRVDRDHQIATLPPSMVGPLMESGLNLAIALRAHTFLQIHAGCLEKNGRAIIMPAASGSGKSTLCAYLLAAGWRLFSDEFAVIVPETGNVVPVPRGISLKNASIALAKAIHPDPEFSPVVSGTPKGSVSVLRAPRQSVDRAHETCPPGAIVFPKWSADAGLQIAPLSRAEALESIIRNSINYSALDELGFNAMTRLIEEVPAFRLTYSDSIQAIDWFEDLSSRFA